MKKSLLIFLVLLISTVGARAQWMTQQYILKGGWNAIYLPGDASYATIDQLLPAAVEQVWRWNPSPNQVQFTSSPLIPSAGASEWSTWRRSGQGNTLTELIGPGAFLVQCSGDANTTHSFSIAFTPRLPRSDWVRNGANLFGFPSYNLNSNLPKMSQYFATFPVATSGGTKIYKYVGGPLGPGNPIQIFSPAAENLDPTKAYWFSAEVVGDFVTPVEISLTGGDQLDFGRSRSLITMRLRNRSNATVTVTLETADSATPPAGQPGIIGRVPLTLRGSDGSDAPLASPFNQVIAPQSSVELSFGIDRGAMSADSSALFASLLHLSDSSNLMRVTLPVKAGVPSLAGLWVGDALVTHVGSRVGPGSTTTKAFPLRWLLHVDDGGTARLLSQAFLGKLVGSETPLGICTLESRLEASAIGSARRFFVAHMPLDTVVTSGSGTVALGSTLQRSFTIPYNDPTNPFVHSYHPDHDNKTARPDSTIELLSEGKESYSITREVSFEFTTSPPTGVSSVGWGTSVLGGNFTEVIKNNGTALATTSGIFTLRRASETGSLTLN